jgi:uncharacterized protein DUF3592
MNNSLFLLHPAHAGFLDNTNRTLYGTNMRLLIMISILALICGAIGAGMTSYALNEQAVEQSLAQNGITKIATVTDGHKTSGRSTTYYLTYSYDVDINGQTKEFTNEETVSASRYDSTAIGAHVSIRYLPDDPAMARLLDEPSNNIILVIVGVAFLVGAAFMIFAFVRQYRRDRTLERDGQIITGSVVKSSINGVGNKRQVHVQYTFNSPLGVELKGKQSERRRDVQLADVPPGTKVAVVYHDDKTFRLL